MFQKRGAPLRWYAGATCVLFAALSIGFFTQDPIEARYRPWRGPHVSEDGWYYYYYLRSAALDGDIDLENDYRIFGNWYGFGLTATGRPHNPFGVGPALFWAPGFLVGHAIALLQARDGSGVVADGMSHAEQGGALFTSLLAAAGAFWLAFRLARRYVLPPVAWFGTAVAFFGGPLVWYAVYSPSMPHALEALFGTAFISTLLPLRRRTFQDAVLLGLIGGAMVLVRPQLVVLYVPLLVEAFERREDRGGAIGVYVMIGLTALLVFAPQMLVWKQVYGSYLTVPQGSGFMRFGASLWSETLFSSRNGLFTTTPLLWFVLPGFYVMLRHNRRDALVLIALFLLQAFVNGAAWDWWGGGAYGGRRFAATFSIWALALSFLLQAVVSRHRLRPIAISLAVAIGAPLFALQWRMIAAHHDRRFSWEDPVPFDERVRDVTGLGVPAYAVLGNPFAFPANLLFAVRHHVPLARYDRAVGPYLLDERIPTTNPLLPSKRIETVRFSDPSAIAFLGRGFEQTPEGAVMRDGLADVFLPLNRTGSLDLDIALEGADGPLIFAFNGRILTGPPFHIDGGWIDRGVNVLQVRGRAATLRTLTLIEGPEWPPAWAATAPGGLEW